MIRIDRLRIRLPASFRASAADIARLVGEGLAQREVQASSPLEHLVVPPVRVPANASGRETAREIVASMHHHLASPPIAKGAKR